MPTFAAPAPLDLVLDVPTAVVHLIASDREDAVVTVLPTDPDRSGSVRAAEEIRVEHRDGTLTVTSPGAWKQYVRPFSAGTAQVTIELPAGSSVRGRAGSLLTEGTLGAVDATLASGDARLAEVTRLALTVSAGSAAVDRIDGDVSLEVGAGSVHIGALRGEGGVRAANGTTIVDRVEGTLEITGAHADLTVGTLHGDLTARTAHGSLRVDRIDAGSASLTTSFGSIEVGVPEGTAAHLDLATEHGTARNLLTPADGPLEGRPTARIRAVTRFGDVLVRRP